MYQDPIGSSGARPLKNLHRIPVSMITGFLGSGKTTLLNRLLHDPALKDALVLINEFGEIGLDHHLVQSVSGDVMLLRSGCLCCTIQSDLAQTLHDIAVRRVDGTIPDFRRVVLETTGLADPAPIVHTLMQSSLLAAQYKLDGVIATVDAVNGWSQLDRQPEAVKQAAIADRIVLTKSDLADHRTVARLRERLAALNPAAEPLDAAAGEAIPSRLFDAGLYNPQTRSLDARRWLSASAYECRDADGSGRHDGRVRALCVTLAEPVVWKRFAAWCQDLADRQGDALLRLKAIVNVKGQDRPLAVHGVQHLFHPPAELPGWPDGDRTSRIVLITRDLDAAMLERSLREAVGEPALEASS